MHSPVARSFESYTQYRSAILEVLGVARGRVAIFDRDLAECGLESSAAITELERLCSESPHTDALRILIKDRAHLERECPRLCAFLIRFAHRATVRRADPDARTQSRPFLIADDLHLAMRVHEDLPRGRINLHDGSATACFTTQFETMWVRGQSLTIGATLGI